MRLIFQLLVLITCLFPLLAFSATPQKHHSKHTVTHKKTIHHATKKTKHPIKEKIQYSFLTNPDLINSLDTEPSHSSPVSSLINFIYNTTQTLRYSAYKLGGTHFDSSKGVYIVDCSSYVDNLLQAVSPQAYTSLVNSSQTEKPTTSDYYNFFTGLSDDPVHSWDTVEEVEELRPGDILVFRSKNTHRNPRGHVMVVMNKPIRDTDSFLVQVADSAPSGHSQDTRSRHVSGIGIGTLLLKVNPETCQPSAYAWKIGSRWEHNVNFAMARPLTNQV